MKPIRVTERGSEDQAELGALGPGVELDAAAARLGHRLHDREPEPGAALLAAGGEEALEDAGAVRLADPGTAIAHREHHPTALDARRDVDGLAGPVAERVVYEVANSRLEMV